MLSLLKRFTKKKPTLEDEIIKRIGRATLNKEDIIFSREDSARIDKLIADGVMPSDVVYKLNAGIYYFNGMNRNDKKR